ncbi:MAG: O-methyltransferase [Armatimonadetes bacterium]|nr:O-methyltransferase [Armatimonadota bacterium]
MPIEQWTAVDSYFEDLLIGNDPVLQAALADSDAAGLPAINVTPTQGKLLHILVKMQRAKNVLEIGTLGGYSTIWMARALPENGKLTTIEYEKKHADVAAKNIDRAGLSDKVEIINAAAIEALPSLTAKAPFDLVFVDADKESTAAYFAWAMKLSRPGTVIIVDNVVRKGEVIDQNSEDESVQGIRRFHDVLSADPRATATAIQTVGAKGYDGFTIVIVD